VRFRQKNGRRPAAGWKKERKNPSRRTRTTCGHQEKKKGDATRSASYRSEKIHAGRVQRTRNASTLPSRYLVSLHVVPMETISVPTSYLKGRGRFPFLLLNRINLRSEGKKGYELISVFLPFPGGKKKTAFRWRTCIA